MKSGFISLIGRTNAGKSTLLNYLIGEKIALVSHKKNATRRKINAIVIHGDAQAIFVDTPGLHESQKLMNKLMVETAIKSLGDCDLAIFVASVFDDTSDYENFLKIANVPHLVVLTKIDLASERQIFEKLSQYGRFGEKFLAILPVSAKKKAYRKILLDEIAKHLPEHEFYYDSDYLTTTNEREIFRDFILEAIFECVSDEVPYNSDVSVKKVVQNGEIMEIYATIITDNAHHKAILIGKNGETIKRIGIVARKLINNLTKSKIFLNINVEIDSKWTNNEKRVKKQLLL